MNRRSCPAPPRALFRHGPRPNPRIPTRGILRLAPSPPHRHHLQAEPTHYQAGPTKTRSHRSAAPGAAWPVSAASHPTWPLHHHGLHAQHFHRHQLLIEHHRDPAPPAFPPAPAADRAPRTAGHDFQCLGTVHRLAAQSRGCSGALLPRSFLPPLPGAGCATRVPFRVGRRAKGTTF